MSPALEHAVFLIALFAIVAARDVGIGERDRLGVTLVLCPQRLGELGGAARRARTLAERSTNECGDEVRTVCFCRELLLGEVSKCFLGIDLGLR